MARRYQSYSRMDESREVITCASIVQGGGKRRGAASEHQPVLLPVLGLGSPDIKAGARVSMWPHPGQVKIPSADGSEKILKMRSLGILTAVALPFYPARQMHAAKHGRIFHHRRVVAAARRKRKEGIHSSSGSRLRNFRFCRKYSRIAT